MTTRLDELTRRKTTVGSTTQNALKTGSGRLIALITNISAASSAVNVRDSLLGASGTVIARGTCLVGTGIGSCTGYALYDVPFTTGLSVEAATGTPDYVLIWE